MNTLKLHMPILYRGEDLRLTDGNGLDRKKRVGTLRECLCASQRCLPTSNIGSNSRYYHFRNSISQVIDHVARSVAPCFLSFTEIEERAFYYASSGEIDFHSRSIEYTGPTQYLRDAAWKDDCALIIKLDISNARSKTITDEGKGCYLVEYDLPNIEPAKGQLLVIDVVTLLKNYPIKDRSDAEACANAYSDKEWLVVPMNESDVGRGCSGKSELIRMPDFPLIEFAFIDPIESRLGNSV